MIQAENLEKTFNLPPQVIEGELVDVDKNVMKAQPINSKLEDSDYIRKNLKELADSTKDALDLALQIQSEDPTARNTEAVAKMADAVTKTLGNLIQLNKTEKDEEFRAVKSETPQTVNNNLIISTTEDIIAKIISQTKQLKGK